MKYEEVVCDLKKLEQSPSGKHLKTKDVDQYNKKLIKENADVSDLKEHVLQDTLVHRTYFQVSLGSLQSTEAQFQFIEENEDLLQDWWQVDQLTQFIRKPLEFAYAYEKAKQYVNSEKPFVRRWGYVLFLTGLQKETEHTREILALMKDDEEYYVQMAEAWLICDLAVFHVKEVVRFLEISDLKYNISGKAIQKMCDSYRISREDKEYVKTLRAKLKQN